MARTSWKAIAERLAGRLANHAFCETHAPDRSDSTCPFCDDRAAYAEYIAAGGHDHRPLLEGGRIISFEEWKAISRPLDGPDSHEDADPENACGRCGLGRDPSDVCDVCVDETTPDAPTAGED